MKAFDAPIFPLNSMVLPGGRLPLQLFERRYLDMLSRCLREDTGFVITLIREAAADTSLEAGFHRIGTLVRVVDFSALDNGVLGIVAAGEQCVRIEHHWQEADGLNQGRVVPLPPEESRATGPEHEELANILRALVQHPAIRELDLEIDYRDARQLGWRLTELLPLDPDQKQTLIELQDPLQRLEQIGDWIESVD